MALEGETRCLSLGLSGDNHPILFDGWLGSIPCHSAAISRDSTKRNCGEPARRYGLIVGGRFNSGICS